MTFDEFSILPVIILYFTVTFYFLEYPVAIAIQIISVIFQSSVVIALWPKSGQTPDKETTEPLALLSYNSQVHSQLMTTVNHELIIPGWF